MTAKKITKVVKKADEVMNIDQLKAELIKTRTALIDARRGHVSGELANPRAITANRKKIAKILTAIRAFEISANNKGEI